MINSQITSKGAAVSLVIFAIADAMDLGDRPVSPAERPQPRPVRSPARSAQIRIQNRRRAYLDKNPEYFKSLEHELVGAYSQRNAIEERSNRNYG